MIELCSLSRNKENKSHQPCVILVWMLFRLHFNKSDTDCVGYVPLGLHFA